MEISGNVWRKLETPPNHTRIYTHLPPEIRRALQLFGKEQPVLFRCTYMDFGGENIAIAREFGRDYETVMLPVQATNPIRVLTRS